MHGLDRPAAGDEPGGEPVEQLGMLGGSPRTPKFEGVATIPRPKWCCQIRLTITRAVSGWSGRVSQSRQLEPSAAPGRHRRRGLAGQEREPRHAARDDRPGAARLAPALERRRRSACLR